MQTLDELMELGYYEGEARRLLDVYKKHIGEKYGCNKITNIRYDNNARYVESTCELCGKVSERMFVSSRNKWSEFPRTCECQRKKIKKIRPLEEVRNDNPEYIGKQYGDFKVVNIEYKKHEHKSGGTIFWNVECVHCGSRKNIKPWNIKPEDSAYRVCVCQREKKRSEKWACRIGEKYGRLTITGFEFRETGKGRHVAYALCKCECGSNYVAQYGALVTGATKSCGCIDKEKFGNRKEPKTKSPLYAVWYGMRYRCNNRKCASYGDYGGRGIKVCNEWNDPDTGFDAFEKWAYQNGFVPDTGLSLDRIDVNGNYEPSNCRYATVYVQAVNKREQKRKGREKKYYTVDGRTMSKEEWCKEYCISIAAVDYRMKTYGWNFETALKIPKTRKGNIFAGEQARARVALVNKCESYIEANLCLAFIRKVPELRLISQEPICGYRVDFLVDNTNIIVECDGYDNHKTKEQIIHDSKRDRSLQKNGYVVLRFTGSEINSDPDACALEIRDIVFQLCGDDVNELRKAH